MLSFCCCDLQNKKCHDRHVFRINSSVFGLFRHDWDFCNFLPAILFVIFETCNDDAVNWNMENMFVQVSEIANERTAQGQHFSSMIFVSVKS